jgi:insertion element IS1 protein InsB
MVIKKMGHKIFCVNLVASVCSETNEVLGYVIGNRSAKQMLKDIEIEQYCTDNWAVFDEVLAREKHQVGKQLTRHIERVNNALRARNRRFVRKTTCFSKKDKYHKVAIKIMFQQWNYDYHTF